MLIILAAIDEEGEARKAARTMIQLLTEVDARVEQVRVTRESRKAAASEFDIQALALSMRTTNALRAAGVETIKELCACRISDLHEMRGVGATAINQIERALAERGLQLTPQWSEVIEAANDDALPSTSSAS